MRKNEFSYGILLMLVTGVLCACSPAGSRHTRTLGTRVDVSLAKPYSIQGMTQAIDRIDAARLSHTLKPLFLEYEKAFKVEPKNPFKRFLWAYAMDDLNQGWQEMAKVVKLNDKFVWAYLGMGIILDKWKLYDQAEKNFESALRLGSGIAACNGRYGRMMLHKGDYEKAIELLVKAVKKAPSWLAYKLDLARAYTAGGNLADAEKTYKEAVLAFPTSFVAYSELGYLLAGANKDQEALDVMTKAAELNDRDYGVRFSKAELLRKLHKKDLVLAAYEDACSKKPDELACWQAMWQVADKSGKKDVEIKAAEQVIRIDHENIQAHAYLAPIYLAQGAIEKALPSYKLVFSKDKKNLDAMLGLAKIYEQGEEWSKALEFNQKVLKKKADQPDAVAAMKRLFTLFHILEEPISGKSPDSVFRANRIQIASVYKARLKERQNLQGSLLIKVTVDNDGKVHDVSIAKDTLGDRVLGLCAVWNLKRSQFPSGFGATYDFDLTLRPGS